MGSTTRVSKCLIPAIFPISRDHLSTSDNKGSFDVLLASCLKRILEKGQGISAWRLQDCGQPSRARARGRDFRANSVTQLYSVKPVAVMSDVIDCLEVHYGMPSDLDER